MLSFYLAALPGVISSRTLTITAVALRGGVTGIRVDAQDTWIMPRLAAAMIPAGVHEIQVTSARRGAAPTVSLKVTAPAKVRRIIRLVDELPTVQSGVAYHCPPAKPGDLVVAFDFRANAGKPLLARARLIAEPDYAPGPCDPISFSIRGHRQTPLVGDGFLTQVQRLLSIHFQ